MDNDAARGIRSISQYDASVRHRERIAANQSFVAYHVTTVSSGGTTSLQLSNPTESGLTADVVNVNRYAEFSGDFRILDEFADPPTGGTDNDEDSMLMDSGGIVDDSEMTIATDPTYTESGEPHWEWPTEATGQGANRRPGDGGATQPLVEPGRDVVYEFSNTSTDSGRCAVSVVFDELPYVPSAGDTIPIPGSTSR